jgi:glycosyltransferase involved in cell wall biosynthesis
MNKKIAIILPYKEIYSKDSAAAASIWVKDYFSLSKLKNDTLIYGNLENKLKPITKNFKNIKISHRVFSKNKAYIDFFYKEYQKIKFDIIEIHNRPEYLNYLIKKKISSKLIFFFHNNPKDIRGSKSINERMFILENTSKIFFVSKWTMHKFFEGLPFKNKSNCEILYPSINKVKKFNKKKKNQIIFTGKLNSSKGYDLFGEAVIKILNKYPNWSVVVAGNEPREKFDFKHPNMKIYPWLPHDKIMNLYNQSSISVVPSKWEEPFGRTSMESAANGCATITSSRGGLTETFNNDLILKKLTSNEIFKMIEKLIRSPKLLKKHQIKNFKNPIHKIENLVKYLDSVKMNFLPKNINIIKNLGPKILHISNFNEKNNQRLFNISIASKITNGLIRNDCDVVNFSYRNYLSQKLFPNLDSDILDITSNYKPDLVLLGHNNVLKKDSMEYLKNKKIKIALWYEDHIADYGPNWKTNLNLIEKNHTFIDNYFITTHPDVIKSKILKKKISYLPIPVDENIETLKIYENKYRYKDLFFALSHGVNYGGLRKETNDEREVFLKRLLEKSNNINFHILGINKDKPKWNYDFYKEIMICKMSLNLSRGKPLKYATSNRIASYIGNGILTFINDKVKFQNLFSNNEMVFYKNEKDLINKINYLKNDIHTINKISKNGKRRYFEIFNNLIVSDSIISKTLNVSPKYNYAWEK